LESRCYIVSKGTNDYLVFKKVFFQYYLKVTKKQYKIMVWLIVWASLLIGVLYSPLGSPDLYYPSHYYAINQSSSAGNGTILNTPKGDFESDNYSNDDIEIPDVSSESGSSYSVGNYQSVGGGMQGSSYGVQSQSYRNNSSSSYGNPGGGGSSFVTGGGSRGSIGTSGMSMTGSLTSMTFTTNISNNLTKQSTNNYTSGSGGTDPGGDPTGNPIPVGDGWCLLFFFGICYAAFKMRFNIQCRLLKNLNADKTDDVNSVDIRR
jgi:hypothetical protein